MTAITTATEASSALARTRWRLDPNSSTAEFRVGTYWGLTTVHGRFTQLDGGIDPAGRMWRLIDATTLDTGNPRRDRHLRSADFFDCEQHPQIAFRCTEFSAEGAGRLVVSGDLSAGGRRLRVTVEAAVEQRGPRLAIDASTTIDQRTLGMTYRRFGIRVPTTDTIHALLIPETTGREEAVAP